MGNPLDDILDNSSVDYTLKDDKPAVPTPPQAATARPAAPSKIELPAPAAPAPAAQPVPPAAFDEIAVIEAIAAAEAILTNFRGQTMKGRALEALGKLKRAGVAIDKATLGLIGEANKQFQLLQHANPALKTFPLEDNINTRAYTYAKKYEYPGEIVKQEVTLKIDKATAVKTGTATLIPKNFNMNKDKLFTISV